MQNIRRTYETEYVRSLFDRIAGRYDLLNHLLSSGMDIFWRRKAIRLLRPLRPRRILDVATGTGDLAFEAARLKPDEITGIDVSRAMLERASAKARKKNLDTTVVFREGRAEDLPFEDGRFDAATVGFGVRNFSSLEKGLSEILRALRPGGAVVILEFSRPKTYLVGSLYRFYSTHVIPLVGGLVSQHPEAYEYLPSTIREFPDGDDFTAILRQTGFSEVSCHTLTFGIVSLYHGIRPPDQTSRNEQSR